MLDPEAENLLPDFDLSLLSAAQAQFFATTQEKFPGIVPREIGEDGRVVFRGLGRLCFISESGDVEISDETAPPCERCAEEIMGKIDAGALTAQCHHCGSILQVEPSND
ncbi:MAG TPA: hypothetical protein VHC21_04610 [Candidatus Saccharimonadales bacterium]|nr:hypothetical protein [Candidatus Saccharimonadales bacterium]